MEELPMYIDYPTADGSVLRVVHEMTTGDMVIASCLILLILVYVIVSLLKILWRR